MRIIITRVFLKNNREISQITKTRTTIRFTNSTTRYTLKAKEPTVKQGTVLLCVFNTTHNNHTGTQYPPVDEWIRK